MEAGKGADKAGIKAGDVIVRVNGLAVNPDETLSYIISGQPVGASVPIDLIRNGKPLTVRALIGERPAEDQLANFARPPQDDFSDQDEQSTKQAAQQLLGVAVQTLTPNITSQLGLPAGTTGVVVTAVDPSTDAGAKGVRRGDVVTQANYERVATDADLNRITQAAKDSKRTAVLLQVQRRGQPAAFVPIRLRGQ